MQNRIAKIIALFLIVLFLFSCDLLEDSELDSIQGAWLLTRVTVSGSYDGESYEESNDYDNIDPLYYRLINITESLYTIYDYNIDTYSYEAYEESIIEKNSSSFTLEYEDEGESFEYVLTYSFSNNQLILEYTEDEGDGNYESGTYYYNSFTDSIPPSTWTTPDENYTSATLISSNGSSINDALEESTISWYKFDAISDVTYTIKTDSVNDETDTVLVLYDLDGTTFISSNDDDWTEPNHNSLDSLIEWTCPANGTYYFKVRGSWVLNTGEYVISVTNS